MIKNTRISSTQLFLLITGYIFGSSAIMNSAAAAGCDAWLAYLLGWLGGFGLITIYVQLAKLNPSSTLVEMLQNNLGKLFGNFIALLYIWYFIHLAALVYRNFGEFIVTVTYNETPMIVIISCLAGLVAYSTKSGIEVGARIGELLVPIIPLVIFITYFSLLTAHDFSAMLPFLEKGLTPVFSTAFSVITFPFGETVVFLMFYPYLNKYKNIPKVSYLSFAVAGSLLLVGLMRDLFVLGPDLLKELSYPAQATARLIPGIGIEPLIDLIFMVGGGVKTGVLIFGAAEGISQIFELKDYKPLVIPIVTFAVVLSVWIYPNITDMFTWATDVYPYYALPFQVIFPVILLIICLIKKHR
jgi:spore germination protein KB